MRNDNELGRIIYLASRKLTKASSNDDDNDDEEDNHDDNDNAAKEVFDD